MSGVIIALDVGAKTIGIAYTDESQSHVFVGETYWRQTEGYRKDLGYLRKLATDKCAVAFVLGMPIKEDGTDSSQTSRVREFLEVMNNGISLPIYCQNEYLSTFAAELKLEESGVPRHKWKETVDCLAAAEILNDYLTTRELGVKKS